MKRSRLRPVSKKTKTQRWPRLKAMREAVLARAAGRCEHCRRTTELDVHHCVKRSQGGADTSHNGIALCRLCHERTDWPYGKGRLIVKPLGNGRFDCGLYFEEPYE